MATLIGESVPQSQTGAHLGASGLPAESGFVTAFLVSAAALALAFVAALLIPRGSAEPVAHGYEPLGEPAGAGAR